MGPEPTASAQLPAGSVHTGHPQWQWTGPLPGSSMGCGHSGSRQRAPGSIRLPLPADALLSWMLSAATAGLGTWEGIGQEQL
jgi:hypothetical protein